MVIFPGFVSNPTAKFKSIIRETGKIRINFDEPSQAEGISRMKTFIQSIHQPFQQSDHEVEEIV